MKEEAKISAQLRTEQGTRANNRLRKQGLVPGVIYGGQEPKNVQFNEKVFTQFLRHHTSENVMLDLAIEGDQSHKVLIREVQHHPISGRPLHADFYELDLTRQVRVSIPLACIGDPVGVTQQGGTLEHLMREIEVECLPTDIIEEFDLDVSALNVGDRLLVKDIPLDRSRYTMITADDVAVAMVAAARVEEAPAAEEGEVGAEPEVIKEKKTEEGKEEK
jgi:large subunit ribosomal protein L25